MLQKIIVIIGLIMCAIVVFYYCRTSQRRYVKCQQTCLPNKIALTESAYVCSNNFVVCRNSDKTYNLIIY